MAVGHVCEQLPWAHGPTSWQRSGEARGVVLKAHCLIPAGLVLGLSDSFIGWLGCLKLVCKLVMAWFAMSNPF